MVKTIWKRIAALLSFLIGVALLATPPHHIVFGLLMFLIAAAISVVEMYEGIQRELDDIGATTELLNTKKTLRDIIDKLPPEHRKDRD